MCPKKDEKNDKDWRYAKICVVDPHGGYVLIPNPHDETRRLILHREKFTPHSHRFTEDYVARYVRFDLNAVISNKGVGGYNFTVLDGSAVLLEGNPPKGARVVRSQPLARASVRKLKEERKHGVEKSAPVAKKITQTPSQIWGKKTP